MKYLLFQGKLAEDAREILKTRKRLLYNLVYKLRETGFLGTSMDFRKGKKYQINILK